MIITVKVPDNTTKLMYVDNTDGWESEPKPIHFGQFVKVEQEDADGNSQAQTVNHDERG